MSTQQITRLTRANLAQILRTLPQETPSWTDGSDRRVHPRRVSRGAIELKRVGDRNAPLLIADVCNISEGGLGVRSKSFFEPDSIQEITVYLPHATIAGKACVRYCAEVRGHHMTGLEFIFED